MSIMHRPLSYNPFSIDALMAPHPPPRLPPPLFYPPQYMVFPPASVAPTLTFTPASTPRGLSAFTAGFHSMSQLSHLTAPDAPRISQHSSSQVTQLFSPSIMVTSGSSSSPLTLLSSVNALNCGSSRRSNVVGGRTNPGEIKDRNAVTGRGGVGGPHKLGYVTSADNRSGVTSNGVSTKSKQNSSKTFDLTSSGQSCVKNCKSDSCEDSLTQPYSMTQRQQSVSEDTVTSGPTSPSIPDTHNNGFHNHHGDYEMPKTFGRHRGKF